MFVRNIGLLARRLFRIYPATPEFLSQVLCCRFVGVVCERKVLLLATTMMNPLQDLKIQWTQLACVSSLRIDTVFPLVSFPVGAGIFLLT